jgi:hypothetical protein
MRWKNKGHEFDSIGKVFERRNRILIYGADVIGKRVCEAVKFLDCLDAFVDVSEEKQKSGFCGFPVYHPDYLVNQKNETHLIIIASDSNNGMSRSNISRRLILAGYIFGTDFIMYEDFIVNDLFLHVFAVYARHKVYISSSAIYPTTKCNLNCDRCLAFTSCIRKHTVKTLDEAKKEVNAFFNIVDFVPWFQISGGEPLLYQHLAELVAFIGANYRVKIGERFEIVTNGTIIPPKKLLTTMKAYNAGFCLDDYTEQVPLCAKNRSSIIDLLKAEKVNFIDNYVEKWFDLDIFSDGYADKTPEELESYNELCGSQCVWHANELGKICACTWLDFAIKAGIEEYCEDDWFDLNIDGSLESKKAFLEFILGFSRNGFVNLCRHCSMWEGLNPKKCPVAVQLPR